MECHYAKSKYVEEAETAFNITVNNHRKDFNNPTSIPVDFHFKKPGIFNRHVKCTLIKKVINIRTTDKDILHFRLKSCEDFWTQ